MKRPADLLLHLLTDVRRLEPGARGLDRDVITIEMRLKNEGDGFLTVALPALCSAFDRALACGKFTCPLGFARIPRGTIPRIFSGMFCEVFDAVSGDLLKEPSIEMICILRQIMMLFKKLVQGDDRETYLDRLAKDQFIKDDISCKSSNLLNERELFVLDRVSKSVLANLDVFDEAGMICKHGPGAVFEHLKPNQKWSALCTYSSALERLGFDVFYGSDTTVESNLLVEGDEYGASGSKARLISVLKNSTSRRTITVEPVVRQFVQQGYNTILRREISKCPVLRQCLSLSNQELNQSLALEGSLTGKWATLDLKSASDKMSKDIVGLVFASKPRFLSGILNCRSSQVQIDDCLIDLEKFAGMGNATTFPVQSVVFAVLAICALTEDKRPSYWNVRRAASSVRVYGDDIIVPTDKVHQVVSWLTKAGLLVNLRKSFYEGNFRESCGVDAYKGVDVTPMYVRHHPRNASKKDPSALAHYVSLSNQGWLRGFYILSSAIKDMVEKRLRKRLPLVASSCGSLGWHTRQEYYESQRWDSDLHRYVVNAPTLVAVKTRDEIDGYAALLKFFHRPQSKYLGSIPIPALEVDDEHLRRSPIRFQLRVVSRWVPSK